MAHQSSLPHLDTLRLEPHPTARSQAVSTTHLQAGSIVISIPSLSTVLLPHEKGRRCDTCHLLQSGLRPLRKCSGCASYWYCDTKCQSVDWQSHHKGICKAYNRYIASAQVQALAPHERLDSMLLSHLVAAIPWSTFPPAEHDASPWSTFLSLLPGPNSDIRVPPVCSTTPSRLSKDLLNDLFSRFGNNNFAVHSHLTSYAHGIFPLASRLFNHSCVPNAAAKYIITPSQPVRMEIVALREILPGEEVCLPYLDPALLQSRHQIFELTYGFKCRCPSCKIFGSVSRISAPPENLGQRSELEEKLREFVGINQSNHIPLASRPTHESIPSPLLCFLNESYLEQISETFSRTSHEGPHDVALNAGATLLALYVLIYPPNYPQIGMHLVELAKTAWNAIISSSGIDRDAEGALRDQARSYLASSRQVLGIFGPEGDADVPLEEIETLQKLLDES